VRHLKTAASGIVTAEMDKPTLLQTVEGFNAIIKSLTTDLAARYPDDPVVVRMQKRTMLAVHATPTFVLEMVGPYLYKYRKEIYAGKDVFFLQQDYSGELKQSKDMEKADMVKYLIPKVKMAWAEANAKRRSGYKETVQELLDWYLDYLSVTH